MPPRPDAPLPWPDVPTAVVRVGQGGFAALYTWKVSEAWLSGLSISLVTQLAVTASFVTWFLGLALGRGCPKWLAAAVILLDIALVGVASLGPPGPSVAMVLLPAIGMPVLYGRRGVLLVLAAMILLVTAPTLFRHGPTDLDLARALVASVATFGAAMIAAVAREHIIERQDTILRQNHELEALLDTVDVGLVLLDEAGKLKAVNRRQRHFIDLVYPDGHPGDTAAPGLVFSSDGVTPLTAQQMPSTLAMRGEEFDNLLLWCGVTSTTRRAVSVSGRTVWDGDGRAAGAVLSFNDVTDLLEALQLRDDFVANVSHGLRTPLGSINLHLEHLLNGEGDPLPQAAAMRLEGIARNTERLDRLVSDLLGSPSPGRAPSVGLIDAATLLARAVESAQPGAAAGDLILTLSSPPNLPMSMDAEAFNQIADNMIHNAVRYTPPGGSVEVELTVRGTLVQLTVSDTGVGIPEDELDLVFTRFYRGSVAQGGQVGGLGLGLSIVQRLVEQHLGTVTVQSREGAGTMLKVRLPRLHAPSDLDAELRAVTAS